MYRYEEDDRSDLKGKRKSDTFREVKIPEKSTDFGIKSLVWNPKYLLDNISLRQYPHE